MQLFEDTMSSIGEVCTMSPAHTSVWKRKEYMVIVRNSPDTTHNRPSSRIVELYEQSTQWTFLSPAKHGLRYV
jgi:hypothetical protein